MHWRQQNLINRRVLRPWFLLMILVCPGLALATEVGERLRLWPDNLFGVVFPTPEVGFISGYAGTFLRTDDGGKTWAWSNVGVNELLRRIAFVDDRRGWGGRPSRQHPSYRRRWRDLGRTGAAPRYLSARRHVCRCGSRLGCGARRDDSWLRKMGEARGSPKN